MNLLRTERETLDAYIPGLDKYLAEIPLLELEQPGNGALAKFRELGGPALLIPAEYEGKGASLLDAVRIQRAVGSRSPSLAVATTMHHFSVASLVELTAAGNGFEWAMLMAIAENSWLLSSGFAEGKPGQHILTPAMRGLPADGGITVSGVKKPCSLTWSMNLMSASVAVADPGTGTGRLAVVLIPADSAGIERAPFWQTTALAAAESDQVTLTDVFVPEALIFYPHDGESMDPIQARGFVWFELLISASYLGAATNLAERVIARGRGSDQDRAALAIELETMAAALEQVAALAATASDNDALLTRALYARFATEQAIERAVMSAASALGGMSFIESPEIAYLLGVARALAFHPPSRAAAACPIARYLAGGPLALLHDTPRRTTMNSHTASTVDTSAFRKAMGSFPTGVTVVTVASGDGAVHGVTVNSFSSVSLDPMLVLVCLNETSRAVGLIERAGAFGVSVLSARQRDVSSWFANQDRPAGSAMFDGVPLEPGATGCPVLAGVAASFNCRMRQSYRAGDHLIVLGEVIALVHRPHLEPLIFHAGTYKSLEQESRRGRTTGRRFARDPGLPGQRPHQCAA